MFASALLVKPATFGLLPRLTQYRFTTSFDIGNTALPQVGEFGIVEGMVE